MRQDRCVRTPCGMYTVCVCTPCKCALWHLYHARWIYFRYNGLCIGVRQTYFSVMAPTTFGLRVLVLFRSFFSHRTLFTTIFHSVDHHLLGEPSARCAHPCTSARLFSFVRTFIYFYAWSRRVCARLARRFRHEHSAHSSGRRGMCHRHRVAVAAAGRH